MERTSCKTDFQSWKGIMALKLLCCNIVAGLSIGRNIVAHNLIVVRKFASYRYIAPMDR